MSNEQEAFEAFCAEWHRQANENGESLTDAQRACAEEAWAAALAWAATQQAPVAWFIDDDEGCREYNAKPDFSHGRTGGTPLYAHPAPTEIEAARLEEREACAQACDRQAELQLASGASDDAINQARRCAADIRKR